MLCTSCPHKPHCVAAQLAQGDAVLNQLLRQLKRCNLRPRRTLWQRLGTFWQACKTRLQRALTP